MHLLRIQGIVNIHISLPQSNFYISSRLSKSCHSKLSQFHISYSLNNSEPSYLRKPVNTKTSGKTRFSISHCRYFSSSIKCSNSLFVPSPIVTPSSMELSPTELQYGFTLNAKDWFNHTPFLSCCSPHILPQLIPLSIKR